MDEAAAAEMLTLCQTLKRQAPSKILRRLAPPDAPTRTFFSRSGGKSVFLDKGVPSQRLIEGRSEKEDRLLQLVRETVPPGASYDHVQLNGPDLCCAPHTDGRNSTPESFILFLGGEGGALCTEDGLRFQERGV